MSDKTKFEIELDIIKIICAILIIYQHVVASFLINDKMPASFHYLFGNSMNLSRFSVVAFMMVSGYLLVKSYSHLSIKNFYSKKLPSFLKLYLMVAIFYLLISVLLIKIPLNFRIVIDSVIFGNSFYHTWYLWVLLMIYILFPLVRYLVKLICDNKRWLYILSFLTICQFLNLKYLPILVNYIFSGTNILEVYMRTYLDRNIIIWFYYFLLGGIFYYKKSEIMSFVKKYILLVFLLWTASFYYISKLVFYTRMPNVLPNYTHTSPAKANMLLFIVLSVLLMYYFSTIIVNLDKQRVNNFIQHFSKYTLGIYIIHPFLLYCLFMVTNYLFLDRLLVNFIVLLIFTTISSIVVTALWYKVKKFVLKKLA